MAGGCRFSLTMHATFKVKMFNSLYLLALYSASTSAITTTLRCNRPEDMQNAGSLDEETRRDMYGKPSCRASTDWGDDTRSKIVGGVLAEDHALPWMVSINRNAVHYCGAALVNKRFVVTAKHCVYNEFGELVFPLNEVKLTLGVNRLTTPPQPTAQTYGIASVVKHDTSDVVVIRLDSDAALNENVWPIWFRAGAKGKSNPLYGPNTADHEEEGIALAAGWGAAKEGDRFGQENLMEALLKLRHDQVCIDTYKTTLHPYDHLTMICAGGACIEDDNCITSDTCQGDSGGPLMYQYEGSFLLLGVTSYGKGCARKSTPGVYVFVYRLRDWLEEQIKIVG